MASDPVSCVTISFSRKKNLAIPTQEVFNLLRKVGIQPTPQRLAIAKFVLSVSSHPTADQVFTEVQRTLPSLSRATVYNTLNLFTQRGLLQTVHFHEDFVRFDANVSRHHHFIDEATGGVYDIPLEELKVSGLSNLTDFDVTEYQVILRGRRKL